MSHEPPASLSNDKTTASAAAPPSTSTTSSPMFELTGLYGRITLDNVYLNGLHALRRLDIQNLSDQPILVKMRSNLRNQIAFQLENENISSLPESTLQSIVTTNTVSWSREAAEEYPFNQLFNYINHIDQIDLEPGQTRSFILAFLPETDNDARPQQQQQNEDDFDMSVAAATTHDDDTETYSMFNVTGSLFFFGYYNTANKSLTDNDSATTKDVLSTSSLADYQVSVKFRASVCQSALWTDVAETGLNFDDCVLGETYYKDFTIQNRSEIDLYWLLNTMDLVSNNGRDWLQFIDADTGDALKSDEPISSFSSKQVRMLFWPKEVGEYNYDLQVENANDARNVVQTKVHATVRSVLRKETLIVSSGHVVDFGDCISGAWAVQQIVLNNVSESPVEVRFLPEGAEVIFDIKQDTTVVEPSEATAYTERMDNTRMNSMRRKYNNHSASRTNTGGMNTPATGISELSGPNSELSSRSSSPTPIRTTTDNDGFFSPALTESPNGSRIHFPSHATIPEDSDSDAGGMGGLMSVDGSIFTEASSFNETSTVISATTASAASVVTSSSNAPVTLSTTESYTRIEDFVLKPGTERVIQVSYRPQKDASITDFNAGQLIRRNFRILLEYGTFRTEEAKEKKVIQCRARTCTSFVEAIPKVINFGDTDVGTLKSLPINIFNRSDILARVELQFSSKVLNCLRGEITIQPRSYVELKLDLYPRKVNPDYRKQITLVNFLNKDNDQIIEVHSTNIDKNRVTFHSLFYRILTATGANFLDFGSIALNSPSLRTFTVENIRDKPLQLEITTSLPEDIAIYTRNKNKVNENALPNAAAAANAATITSTSAIASSAALNAASAMIATATNTTSANLSSSSKLSNSITAEAIEKGDVLADIPATSLTPALSNRRRSKLLLESISNRRIAKPKSLSSSSSKDTAKTKKHTSESEATNKRRTSDAKKELMAARRMRQSVQQLKMDQAHSSTAYLDLALPPLHSLKSYRRKMIQVNSDPSFLKHHHRKGLHSRLLHIPEEKDCVDNKDMCATKDAVQSNKSQHHPRQMVTKKSNASAAASGKHTKHGKEDMLLTTGGRHHLRVSTPNNSNSTATASPSIASKNASRLSSHTRHNNYGTRNAKTKRSLGITAARYKSRKNLDWSDIAGKSRVPFEDLISVLEHGSKASPPLFPKQSAEEQFVRYQLAWRRELDRLIEKGVLVRTSLVDVDPKGEEEVVIVITPCGATKPHIQSAPKKQDARIFLRLVQFDRDIEQTEFENLLDTNQTDIPVREVILRSQLCRSVMDLGQKNINFGLVERNERHAKTIVLHNRSETPLLYAIRKSGSIASGDIDLDVGRYGVVRSYGKREVEFVFEPTLSGPFMEKLVIENIRDRTNDQVLLLKAQVRKPSTFLIKSLEMSFGRCLVDQPCQRTETIVLTNTNKQSRMFEVRVDPNEVIFGRYYGEFDFDVKEDDTNTISKEAEEEIENLEQKLKIAKRKAQPDKVKKYLRKLAKLKNLDHDDKEDADSGKDKDKEEKVAKSAKSPAKTKSDADAATTTSSSTNAVVSVAAAATSSIKESNIVFKKTAESVVFPLDAHASKTVSVTFKPVLRPFQTAEDAQEDNKKPEEAISVKGRILVHEYKNTDVCKSIVYTAEVYTDEAAYIDALALENDGENTGAASTRADAAAMATANAANAANATSQAEKSSAVAATTPHTSSDASQSETSAAPTEQEEEEPEAIQLERHFFDGGRVELNQEAVFYVKVTNTSQQPIGFALSTAQVPSVFDFDAGGEASKELLPGETRKIRYGIKPTQVGKQQYTFSVRNKRTGSLQPFTIECLVHCSTYLEFPSLADEANGVLDLGFSYVDPGSKYSQVTPLLVENKSGQDVFITCQSNLSHQVLIFMDEAGERGLVEMMPLKCGSMTTVWVAVQPNLLTGYLGNSADECRELVGGIKFSVYEKDQQQQQQQDQDQDQNMLLMLTQTVKFISIIGQSHLEVSDKVINMGYTDLLQKEFYGAFTIKNKSGELPLDYEVECSSANIELDRRGGTLHGWRGTKLRRDTDMSYLDTSSTDDQKKRKGSLASLHANDSSCSIDGVRRGSYDDFNSVPASLTQITFRISAYRYGLLNEKLIVTNKRNSQEVFVIDVRLFVDCKKLDAWALPSKKLLLQSSSGHQNGYADDDYDQTDHREADPLPLIKWESIYISPVTTSAAQEEETVLQIMELPEADAHRLYVRELDIANTSGQPMQLVVMSDVDITAGFAVDEDKVKAVALEHKDNLFAQRSGQLSLQPGQRIRVRLHNPSAEKLDEDGRSLALHGQSGSLKGMMVLYDARQNIEVLALELEALFCVSHTELVVDRIDLGKIGHSTSFKPARFEFQISNLADVPATYDINAPKYINFTPLDRNGVAVKQKMFYIPSRKTQRIEGLLMPKEMPDQTSGLHRFDVRIDNLRNHANSMHLHLKALMTVFELRFERLSSNGELVLPTLHHPIALQNAPCDNWFVIHNKTDDDLRFEIGADITPELSPYVHLDVLSRYTNSPLHGDIAIGPQGSIEVRVRASPNEASRLPRNRPEFTDPSGIIMAKLWVTTRPAEEDEEEDEEDEEEGRGGAPRTSRMREMIPVRCALDETATFALSERRLDFKLVTYYQDSENGESSDIMDSACMPENLPLNIINHAIKVPLRFKVTVEGPAEFPAHEIVMISGLNQDRTGIVAPGGTTTLQIAISNPKESMPGQLKIHVDDLDALGESRQTVSMYVTEIVWDL
ncbi:uncharacterized protein ATC70_001016 [Mucor velutinosus]|uniref:Uncharacterized protein n=1 Tax=Mucor velutinosus TaxID=708070 RepID=A0AAN7DKI0_9FUNG|nr:hypothetical protein ATC70_001016 [Mucor velutinosus]